MSLPRQRMKLVSVYICNLPVHVQHDCRQSPVINAMDSHIHNQHFTCTSNGNCYTATALGILYMTVVSMIMVMNCLRPSPPSSTSVAGRTHCRCRRSSSPRGSSSFKWHTSHCERQHARWWHGLCKAGASWSRRSMGRSGTEPWACSRGHRWVK